jgi:hypothetical protein
MGTKIIIGKSESFEGDGELEPLRRNPIKNKINRTTPINKRNTPIKRRTVLSNYNHKPAKKKVSLTSIGHTFQLYIKRLVVERGVTY